MNQTIDGTMEPKLKKRHAVACAPPPSDRESEDSDPATFVHLLLTRTVPAIPSQYLAPTIFAFLNRSKGWTFEIASATGASVLLDRIVAREWPGVNDAFRRMRLLYNVELAAKKGHVDVLHWWLTKYLTYNPSLATEIFRIAAHEGHLHVIEWLCQGKETTELIDAWDLPLVASNPEIVRWVYKNWSDVPMRVPVSDVATQDDLKFLKWLRSKTDNTCELGRYAAIAPARNGQLDIVQYLLAMDPTIETHLVFREAAQYGHLHIVQWLLNEDEEFEEQLSDCWDDVNDVSFHVIKWFVEQYAWKEDWTKEMWLSSTIGRAASADNMEMVEYLYKNLPPKRPLYTQEDLFFSGSVKMAKWLHVRGIECESEDLIKLSVESGVLEMVQWVHETYPNLRTTTATMDSAACSDVDIVKFLHENRPEGCTAQALNNAAGRGSIDVVKFLLQNRSEGDPIETMNQAAASGCLEAVKILHEHDPKSNTAKALTNAACHGHLRTVQWLYTHRVTGYSISAAILRAAYYGHLNVVAYLAPQGDVDFEAVDVKRAVDCGHFHLLEWLLETGKFSVEQTLLELDGVAHAEWCARIENYGTKQANNW